MTGRRISDPEVQVLAGLAGTMRTEYADNDMAWEGSPFAWIKARPSRQVGAIGERLVAGWCATKQFDVMRALSSDYDRLIGGLRTEIKFSTLWRAGGYKFQQLRDQDYQIAICLGISPFDAHCWAIPKRILMQHVIGHTPQHGGRRGSDTAWLHVKPDEVPSWLAEWGGRLADAHTILEQLVAEAQS